MWAVVCAGLCGWVGVMMVVGGEGGGGGLGAWTKCVQVSIARCVRYASCHMRTSSNPAHIIHATMHHLLRPSLHPYTPPPLPCCQVHIEPGHRHGSKITFRGEAGSDSPDVLPGDLIFVLEQKDHPDFKRIGSDLFYEKKVGCFALGFMGWCGWVHM